MISVLLVDDQELIREGLAIILNAEPDIRIAGAATDGAEGVQLAADLLPDVILMDIKMPRMDGIQATREINKSLPQIPVIILTTYADDELVFEGIRAGASGYLLKDISRQQLAQAVRGAARGEAQINPTIASNILAEFQRMANLSFSEKPRGRTKDNVEKTTQSPQVDIEADSPASRDRWNDNESPLIESLTPREETILRLLTEGLTNAGIAARLYLSEGTVKNHVSEILRKLQANDRTHAVVLAIKRGLLTLDS
ncbi:MAG: response regulator transcription factor [Anaerolineales bacterium]|nr:response regulator transcription factor [Anaerolineales bacterium]